MKIHEIVTETTSGGIAVVAQPVGNIIKRSADASIYTKKKTRKRKQQP
jgi:hypothetical protein